MIRKSTLSLAALAVSLPAIAFAQAGGKEQLAGEIGVNADNFTVSELIRLDKALDEDDAVEGRNILEANDSDVTFEALQNGLDADARARIDAMILEMDETGMTRDNAAMNGATGGMAAEGDGGIVPETSGKEQIAGNLNVPADQFTLNQLIDLQAAVNNGDELEAGKILDEAGVDIPTSSIM